MAKSSRVRRAARPAPVKSPAPASSKSARAPAPQSDDVYLEQLGQRVRRMRALRGMSRKVLAQVSGISERYIAQLESGKGNVSIVLLRHIAQAAGVPVEDLIAEADESWLAIREQLRHAPPASVAAIQAILIGAGAPARNQHLRIALIGLRGAGKSTLGRKAAQALDMDFIELNRDIEDEQGFSVTEIFKLYGQEGYRRMEASALKRIAARNRPMIVATGGGVVAEAASFDFLLKNFRTIWIKASPAEHMQRVRDQGDLRPMANDRAAMKELVTILTSREPFYSRASAAIDTSGKTESESLRELLMAINTG